MKKKIIGMIVCMLLIGTTGVAVADWAPGDGYKMHYPQLPDPTGWDVNFHDWSLADDWQCTETGPVTDIHFWISWRSDIAGTLPYIKVDIYSNNPGSGYSEPLEKLWTRTFTPDQFLIKGPWTGDQGWFDPAQMLFIPHDHTKYYQINIKNITDPFVQQNGTLYWLVIQMPYLYPLEVGWKSTVNKFMDTAVWGNPGAWTPVVNPISGPLDFAFVITGGVEEQCCLTIEHIAGGLLGSPSSLKVQAAIKNNGTAECKNITWSVRFVGGIVLWGPQSGTVASLLPGATVNVSSKVVIGFGIPSILPCNVTVTVDGENNACGTVHVEKSIVLLIFLFSVIP